MTGKDRDPDESTPGDETEEDRRTGNPTAVARRSSPAIEVRSGLAPGEVLAGRYKIIRLIAHGGMGAVYEAHDGELRTSVALKTIKPELASDAMLERFRRELYLARKVTHPNVCRLFDLGRHKNRDGSDTLFLTMELLAGETLSKLLKRDGKLAPDAALPIVRQIASAVAAAHAVGIVHRDLKPGNVMLVIGDGGARRAIVTDFGVAHGASDPFGELSGTGDVVGSPAYMAPEQLEGGKVMPSADIYALGIVIYELVTGVRPFQGESSLSAVVKRLKTDPPPPTQHVPDLDPRWVAVIMRCLARDPALRFASADEVVRALEGEALIPTGSMRAARPGRRWLIAVLAAASVAVCGTIGYLATHRSGVVATAHATAGRRSIAVFGFKNLAVRPDVGWLATAIAEMISMELGAGDQLRTISGEDIAHARVDLGLPDAETYSKETLAKLHDQLGADLVIVGSYLTLGNDKTEQLRVNARVQDTRTGELVGQVSDVATIGQVADLVTRIDGQLRGPLGVDRASSGEQVAARAALPTNPEALRAYSEGLAKLRVFDAVAARTSLERAATLEPDHPMIHAVLAEAWTALGYDPKALVEAKRANELAGALPSIERRLVEARYHEAAKDWDQAIAIYRKLAAEFPDDLEHGLRLANAQVSGSKGTEAIATIGELRRLPAPLSEDPRIDLLEAAAAEATSDFAREIAASDRVLVKGQRGAMRIATGLAHLARARAHNYQGKPRDAIADCDAAIVSFGELGDRNGEALAFGSKGFALYDLGDRDAAVQMYERAAAIRREMGDHKNLAKMVNNLGNAAADAGQYERAAKLYAEASQLAHEVGFRSIESLAFSNLSFNARMAGDPRAALAWVDKGMAAAPPDDQRNLETLGGERGRALFDLGDLAGARQATEGFVAIARKIGAESDVEDGLSDLAWLRLEANDLAGARDLSSQAIAMEKRLDQRDDLAMSQELQAEIALAEGRLADAETSTREAVKALIEVKDLPNLADGLQLLVFVRVRAHHVPEAREALHQLVGLGLEGLHFTLGVARATAAVDAAAGQTARAAIALDKAREQARAAGLVRIELAARLELTRLTKDRQQLATLVTDARAKGFERIAREAEAIR